MSKKKYAIPEGWEKTCNGGGCECGSWSKSGCACGADWTPRETWELRMEVNALLQLNESLGQINEGGMEWATH